MVIDQGCRQHPVDRTQIRQRFAGVFVRRIFNGDDHAAVVFRLMNINARRVGEAARDILQVLGRRLNEDAANVVFRLCLGLF